MTERVVLNGRDRLDARVSGDRLDGLDERHTCLDMADTPLFVVERYRAVGEASYTVTRPGGDPLATYVGTGSGLEVRDGTSAPVARLEPVNRRFEIIETGGDMVAFCWREPCLLGNVMDERWGLVVFDRPHVLHRLALVAAPLVCWLLWQRRPVALEPLAVPGAPVAPPAPGSVQAVSDALSQLFGREARAGQSRL
jgi:hypothetical protein